MATPQTQEAMKRDPRAPRVVVWATLGELALPLRAAPEELGLTWSATYSEHSRIGAPPTLQFGGVGTRELRIPLRLAAILHGNIRAVAEKLLRYGQTGEVVEFVLTDAEGFPVSGRYVLTEFPLKITGQSPLGEWTEIEMDLVLREWVEPTALVVKKGEAVKPPGLKKAKPRAAPNAPGGPGYPTKNPYNRPKVPNAIKGK